MEDDDIDISMVQDIRLPPSLNEMMLTRSTLLRLRKGRWFNDTLLDAYSLYLSRVKFNKENVVVFSTFFMPSLMRAINSHNNINLRGIQRPRSVDIFQKDLVIFPGLVSENHWVLFLITNPKRILLIVREFFRRKPDCKVGDYLRFKLPPMELMILDSYPPAKYDAKGYFDALRRFIEAEFERHVRVKIEIAEIVAPGKRVECSPQENTYDCGVHVLHNMEKILESIPLSCTFTEEMIPAFTSESIRGKRKEILYTFMNLIQNQVR